MAEMLRSTLQKADNTTPNGDPVIKPDPKPPRKPGGKKPFPENIPREVKIHDLSEEEKICKNDLTPLVVIGEDIVEKLDVVPVSLKVIQHHYLALVRNQSKKQKLLKIHST